MAGMGRPGRIARPLACKYCGKSSGLIWRQIAPSTAGNPKGTWRMFDADATGAATGQHRCIAGSVPPSIVAAANAGATHCGGTCGTATCPDVQAAIASGQLSHGIPTVVNVGAVNDAADAVLADSAIELQAIYDALAENDAREAKREPKHSPKVEVYAPNSESGDAAMTIDGISTYVPSIDRDYLIDSAQLAAIQRLIKRVERSKRPANIGLYGEPGSGKTTLGIQIAAMRRGPVVVCEASAWQTPDEVYATTTGIDRESGAVQARASRFVMGIETPGATVVINDVANLQNPRVQNGLNELLDPSTRATFVEALGRAVRVAPGVMIVGTWNTNTISATELSGQILDRFASGLMFEVPLPTNGALAHILTARTGINRPGAQRLAALAEWLRNDAEPIPVATRRLIAAAEEVVDGASIGHAIAYTIFAEFDATERARAYQIISVQVGDGDQAERDAWATPVSGDYQALGDVISENVAEDAGGTDDADAS